MKRILLIVVIVLFSFVSLIFGQDYLKTVSKVNIGPMMGQPASESISFSWLSPKGMRMDFGEGAHILFRAEDSAFFVLYPDKKQYSVITLEKVKPMIDQMDMMAGELKVSVEDTGRTEKVGEWDTKVAKYIMTSGIGETKITSWDSTKYTITPMVKKYYDEWLKYVGKRAALTEAMLKSNGMPIKMDVEMTMMGEKMTFLILTTEISEDKTQVPDLLFEIPSDYKEIPLDINVYWMAFSF